MKSQDVQFDAPNNAVGSNSNYARTLGAAGTSGFVGAYASFFFEGAKKRLQSNQNLPSLSKLRFFPWVRESFRGSSGFAASLVPTSIAQQMTKHYFEKTGSSPTPMQKNIEVIFSGGIGGVFSTMVENVILQQQMTQTGPKDALVGLINQGNTRIFRGLPLIMGREAVFGYCYLKGADEASNYATTHFGTNYALPAQLAVGACGSLISHPLDTTATTMQRYDYSRIGQSVLHLWRENGVRAFYKGAGMRVGLFTTAMLSIKVTQAAV